MPPRVTVGMTGATGQIYGVKALELLQDTEYESHLILSEAAKVNLSQEADRTVEGVQALADAVHSNENIGASIASGSFETVGMLVAPCSMKTLSNIAHGNSGNLISRAADVVLKERRPLVVMPREKPFNRIHIKNMLEVTDAGGLVFPPFPSFYQRPSDLDEMVSRTMVRVLGHLDVTEVEYDEWTGLSARDSG